MEKKTAGLLSLLAVLLSLSCSEYELRKVTVEPDPGLIAPEIDVNPPEHQFGNLSADGDIGSIIVTIRNDGNDLLILDDASLVYGISEYSLSSLAVGELEPGETTDLTVTYDPSTYKTDYEEISILSNDPDEPDVRVPLDGSGDAPVIQVTPSYHDFGILDIGCDESLGILIENIGNVNLTIDDLQYFASLPVDFAIEDWEAIEGPLPWTLAPGDFTTVGVDYIPLDDTSDGGWLEVMSNDPTQPIATAEHVGLADYAAWVTDSFTQDESIAVDILFVVDNSGSMGSNQTNLKNNFDAFIAVFTSAGADFQIAIITTDSSDFVGSIIDHTSADPVSEFNSQVDSIGTGGSPYEKGLWNAYESTTTGEAATTGFIRSTARLVVVYVSDEPDFSHQTYGSGGSTTMDPADYAASLLSLKSSADLVAAHAVAGDYPTGCSTNGGAQFGDGYYDVVTTLGGTFMSICASDWSVTMDTLARDSIAILSWPMSDTPIEETIEVQVDGAISTDWYYDSVANSITFTIPPAEGSAIDVTYAIWAECGEEETSGE
tara:strand:+ start:878 stop:2515 length:1638 start_codon:yes stop_codon:yes gene_type:complete